MLGSLGRHEEALDMSQKSLAITLKVSGKDKLMTAAGFNKYFVHFGIFVES